MLLLVPLILVGGMLFFVYGTYRSTAASGECALATCPSELSERDTRQTFRYRVGDRFGVFLNEHKDPRAHLSCSRPGILDAVSAVPDANPPMYWARFEAVATGTCALSSLNFSATIIVEQ